MATVNGIPKGIRRVDSGRTHTHGWYATVRRKSGQVVRLFSDGTHGGKRPALRAAATWLDMQWDRYPKVPRVLRMNARRRNNRSGISGVYRWPADGRDTSGAYWGAQWVVRPNDRPRRRKFSIALHSESGAKRLAAKARRSAIAVMSD